MWSIKYHFSLKEPGLHEEIANEMCGARNIQELHRVSLHAAKQEKP